MTDVQVVFCFLFLIIVNLNKDMSMWTPKPKYINIIADLSKTSFTDKHHNSNIENIMRFNKFEHYDTKTNTIF